MVCNVKYPGKLAVKWKYVKSAWVQRHENVFTGEAIINALQKMRK